MSAAEGSFDSEDLNRIYKMQNGRCPYCKERLNGKYQIDHIKPLSSGGSNYPNNIQLLCYKRELGCNQKKGNKDPIEYAQSIGLLV